ncbi:MAG: nickel-dependent hydrogenase large subunit, partial [Candidatus Thermoplasmatota archaeon]|nr:nickel-dependent hydrogenase large subunit [Candidatus Thermoplasmatota archaeon]
MTEDVNIHVKHLTRVEGHGNIIFNTKNGEVSNILWEVDEAPRFFEAFVRGKTYQQLSHITSRICGICSIGHSIASLRATEAAMSVEITKQTELLRRLALHGEVLQSHSLHVGYLVAPDLLGAPSVVPLVKTHKDAVIKIVSLHKFANYLSDLTCGRTIHPITLEVGGFTSIPTEKELVAVRKQIEDTLEVTREVAGIVLANAHKLPDFHRETEFLGLTADDHYAYYKGDISSTDGGRWPAEEYLRLTNEFVVPQSTAKYCKHNRDSYMTGALARLNINYKQLSDEAKGVAEMFNLQPVCHNPYMNSVAQLVEIVDCLVDSTRIIDELLSDGLKNETNEVEIKAGRG